MTPLQIDCRLAGPWVPPPFGQHLDGLLAWVAVEETMQAGIRVQQYADCIRDLPLARHDAGVWCASVFQPVGWKGQERRCLIAKTDTEAMSCLISEGVLEKKGGSTIDTQRGIAKNANVFFTVEHAIGLRAWCIGDEDGVRSMLERVTAIGTKTRMGFGSLVPFEDGACFQVTPSEDAREGWKARSSPVQLTEQSYPAIGSFEPPYWRGNHVIFRPFPARHEA